MNQSAADNLAWELFSQPMRDAAKVVADRAIQDFDVEAIVDRELPGIPSSLRDAILESGQLMRSKGVGYLNVANPVDIRWDEAMDSPDAMVATFD